MALPVQEKHLYLEKIEETIANGKMCCFCFQKLLLTKQIIQRLEKKIYGKQLGFIIKTHRFRKGRSLAKSEE